MEWRGAQLNGCQFTHGMIPNVMYTGVMLRDEDAEAAAKTKKAAAAEKKRKKKQAKQARQRAKKLQREAEKAEWAERKAELAEPRAWGWGQPSDW